MILSISFDALIKRRNYASEKLKNHRISNFEPLVFAANDWLFNTVYDALTPLELNILRTMCTNKAVSDGAIFFYLDHFVRTRVSKLTYGDFCHIPYDSSDSEHVERVSFISISGSKRINDYFDVILAKAISP
ncbi:hypothetical protein BYT27DRAFT_7258277 [Phlegmacium glaucopus]|nr:hypothetical protein BYT27DRAFT_7258277 [Phlegmacium glaucopus]